MTIITPERTSQAGVVERQKSPGSTKVVDIVDNLLYSANQLPDDEVDRQFAMLVAGATRLDLHKYADQGQIDEYRDVVPGVDELIDRIHQTAEEVLERGDSLTDEDAVLTVNYLGLAADLTNDKELLGKTLSAMHDTQDYSLVDLKRALMLARDRDMLFYRAYRVIQNGKQALAAAATQVPMSQREGFNKNDPLAKWLSIREIEMPRHHSRDQIKEALGFQALYSQNISAT